MRSYRQTEAVLCFEISVGLVMLCSRGALANEFRRRRERIQRERGGKTLQGVERAVRPAQNDAFQPAAIERQAQQDRRPFAFPKIDFSDVIHFI